jgi:hypothetical protein
MALNVRRKYDAHLVLGAARPWKPAVWKKLAAALEPVFGAPVKTAVRTNQKLGRLGWADGAKWTAAQGFTYGEVWSPSWTDFARSGQPPDAFLHFLDPRIFGTKHTDGVASYVLFAVAVDGPVHAAVKGSVEGFLEALEPVKRFTARRAWARNAGGGGFDDSLQDLLLTVECDENGRLRLPAAWKPAHV